MINTVNTKLEQLTNGYFKTGSGNHVLLIIGSCRSVPYMNYFEKYNNQNGNPFTICFIDPFNFHYDINDNRIDCEEKINSLETDENILNLLRSTKTIIHEYYNNFGMFCFDKKAEKNIYQYGLKPEIDICIPNYNDCFVLYNDIVMFDMEARLKATQDLNVLGKLSVQTEDFIYQISQRNLQKFYNVCHLSDLPEMAIIFMESFKNVRYFHTYNHVSKNFTLSVLWLMNKKFLHLNWDEIFEEISSYDMFDSHYTKLTEYDRKVLGINWDEETVSLRDKL